MLKSLLHLDHVVSVSHRKSGPINHCEFLLNFSIDAPRSLVRLCRMITREIEYSIDDIFYWTDSMSVLRYIMNNKPKVKNTPITYVTCVCKTMKLT
jgi:hypothetical protein